jgi:hypothetical protein
MRSRRMHMYTVRQLCLLRGARRVLLCHFSSFGRLQCAPAQAQTHVAALLLREPLVMAHATAVPQWGALKHPLVRRAVPLKSMENGSRSAPKSSKSPSRKTDQKTRFVQFRTPRATLP